MMIDCSSSSTSAHAAISETEENEDSKQTDTCNGYTTPQQQQQQQHQHIDNSIFNTISKIVNPTQTKVPDIHDFKIVKPISRGAFGKVFLGHKNSNPEQIYAIKVMKKNEMIHKNMASQVIIERNALALVKSPYCVQLFYSLQSATSVYLVMEYMVGGDLKSLLGVYGFMEESMAAFYTAEISLALEYLHSHGIVHRDIKPDNMLLSKQGHVKLTDFGLSKITTTMHRDLEISDLVNCCSNTPSLCARTPGQLLSLTSHLTFDYSKSSTIMSNSSSESICKSTSLAQDLLPELQARAECDYSRVSGISPFHSAEQDPESSSGSYHTCEASSSSATASSFASSETNNNNNNNDRLSSSSPPESDESTLEAKHSSLQPIMHHLTSPLSSGTNRRRILLAGAVSRGTKRKRKDKAMQQQQATGLTAEICLMDLEGGGGDDDDSTPKKKNQTPTHQVDRRSTDSRVAFSTPVSAAAAAAAPAPRDEKPILKSTRFNLPAPQTPDSLNSSSSHQQDISPITTPAAAPASLATATTPYRTPKSVRLHAGRRRRLAAAAAGQQLHDSDDRILGTPDYLAPELLLRQGHGPAVDWWALGVCLYEFCTGVPPFNDETPQAVFANILARELQWPTGEECLTDDAMEAIDSLLTLDQSLRPAAKQVRSMKLFQDFPWHEPSSAVPPFVPQPDDNYDTCYFQARNILQHLNVSNCDT